MTIYYCREDERLFTEKQLRADFETFRACGDTYSETFADYMRNALDKNGALEIVRTDFSAAHGKSGNGGKLT